MSMIQQVEKKFNFSFYEGRHERSATKKKRAVPESNYWCRVIFVTFKLGLDQSISDIFLP